MKDSRSGANRAKSMDDRADEPNNDNNELYDLHTGDDGKPFTIRRFSSPWGGAERMFGTAGGTGTQISKSPQPPALCAGCQADQASGAWLREGIAAPRRFGGNQIQGMVLDRI